MVIHCCERSTLVKVCGITRQEDADDCLAQEVALLGFIFHPESPRNVTVEQAAAINTGQAMRVGVFVDQPAAEVRKIMRLADLHLAQLHGGQDQDYCHSIGRSRVMRVFWPERYASREEFEAEVEAYVECSRFFLFDAGVSGGGHGRGLKLDYLAGFKTKKAWFLAGGLGPDNIREAIRVCNPCGVDLNSGVEQSPGIKDHEKIQTTLALLCECAP